jgi:hypothetical protein
VRALFGVGFSARFREWLRVRRAAEPFKFLVVADLDAYVERSGTINVAFSRGLKLGLGDLIAIRLNDG